jgi:hypothetical protein
MLKLSRNLLDSMDRFVLDTSAPTRSRRETPASSSRRRESHRDAESEYAELAR